jgi:hypothetical protein
MYTRLLGIHGGIPHHGEAGYHSPFLRSFYRADMWVLRRWLWCASNSPRNRPIPCSRSSSGVWPPPWRVARPAPAVMTHSCRCHRTTTPPSRPSRLPPCKCNQALIVGFGDSDHAIRELIRFIEMTSRRNIKKDVVHNGGAPNYKR